MLRRAFRLLSTVMIVGGVLLLAWAFVIWKWNDPITGFYTRWEQRQLASSFEQTLRRVADEPQAKLLPTGRSGAKGPPAAVSRKLLPAQAKRFWHSIGEGDPVARLKIDRLGLNVIVVKGTDSASLKKGPGVDGRTALPGEGQLVYIAGHRTTYLAPFSHIDRLQRGDSVQLDTPYAHFDYVVTGHRIVQANDLSVLKSPGHEVLALQACHPRFFATQRYIVYARPRDVTAPATATAAQAAPHS